MELSNLSADAGTLLKQTLREDLLFGMLPQWRFTSMMLLFPFYHSISVDMNLFILIYLFDMNLF
jgi:hypothetical protein